MAYISSSRLVSIFSIAVVVIAALFVVQTLGVTLGTVGVKPSNTVTVSGSATSEMSNQVGVYSAGVTETNVDRQTAVSAVNSQVDSLISSIKAFGIADEDIKTQNLSLYQIEEPIFREDRIVTDQESVWQASNTVEVKLRDVDRASELTDLLTSSGATNVYGPTFQLDVTGNPEDELIDDAIANAREKAEQIAASSGQRLGGVVNVAEGAGGSGYYPMPMFARDVAMSAGGESAPVEPGTSLVSKSVTVTFALRPKWFIFPW